MSGTERASVSGLRARQKLRTRNALLQAAAQLMREDREFSVADAADLAQIGRTTAYRYFANIDSLIAHATLSVIADVTRGGIDELIKQAGTVQDRLCAVIGAADRLIAEHENLFRAALSLSFAPGSSQEEAWPQRYEIRRSLLDEAIGSIRPEIGDLAYDRLVASLNIFVGIESVIVLRDVCRLSHEKARQAKLWGGVALLEAALAEGNPDGATGGHDAAAASPKDVGTGG